MQTIYIYSHPSCLDHKEEKKPLMITNNKQRIITVSAKLREYSTSATNLMKVPISIAQLNSTSDFENNFTQIEKLVNVASKEHKSSILFLPECFSFIADNAQQMIAFEQDLNGDLFTRYRHLARHYNIPISFGGFPERHPSIKNKIFNSHILVDSKGDIVSIYRKLHLFDVDIKHKNLKLMESDTTVAGSDIVLYQFDKELVPLSALNFGLSICFDLRFPEQYLLMKQKGANCMLVPSAFTKHTGSMGHWHTLLKARAIENECFVIASAQTGKHNEKRVSYGHSLVVDPWGQVLCDMNEEAPAVQRVELDLAQLSIAGESIPLNKRNDVYQIVHQCKEI